jgi:hypothetical protein
VRNNRHPWPGCYLAFDLASNAANHVSAFETRTSEP